MGPSPGRSLLRIQAVLQSEQDFRFRTPRIKNGTHVNRLTSSRFLLRNCRWDFAQHNLVTTKSILQVQNEFNCLEKFKSRKGRILLGIYILDKPLMFHLYICNYLFIIIYALIILHCVKCICGNINSANFPMLHSAQLKSFYRSHIKLDIRL